MLGSRRGRVVTARPDEAVEVVVRRMKEHDVSQIPVVDGGAKAVGMVHESDLLHFLLDGRHRTSEPVSNVMAKVEGLVSLDTPLDALRRVFAEDRVALVQEGGALVGIVTKIDVIDALGRRSA